MKPRPPKGPTKYSTTPPSPKQGTMGKRMREYRKQLRKLGDRKR